MGNNSFYSVIPGFKAWWSNKGHSKGSVSSYVSYVKKAIKVFENFGPVKNNGLDNLLSLSILNTNSVKGVNKLTRDIELLMIIALKESNYCFGKKKTYSNALSGLILYFNYLYEQKINFEYSEALTKIVKKALSETGSQRLVFNYTNKEVCSVFDGRLATQDRAYEHLCLSLMLLNQIFAIDKDLAKKYKTLKIDKRNSTKFIIDISAHSFVRLSDIVSLEIHPNKKCFIHTKNKQKYGVFTEACPFNNTNYELMKVIDINEISIDHDITQKELLEKEYNKYPYLIRLTKMLADYFNYAGQDYKELRPIISGIKKAQANDIIVKNNIDLAFANNLFNEIEKMYQIMGYTAMYGPYNSKKSG